MAGALAPEQLNSTLGMRAFPAFAIVASLTLLLDAQELIFRAGAQTVSVYATVRDRDGHLVTGLTGSNAVVEVPGPAFLPRAVQPLDPAELLGTLTAATGGLHLLHRPADVRQRNPGPMVTQIMEALRQSYLLK